MFLFAVWVVYSAEEMASGMPLHRVSEVSAMSDDAMKAGLELEKSKPINAPPPVPRQGIFSGAGDSGVWPGQVTVSPTAFLSPLTLVFIGVWYVTGALTNSTSKQTLNQFKGAKPFLSLTLMQHIMAVIGGNFAIRVLKIKQYKSLPAEAHNWGFYRLLFVYSVGFCLTNGSFGAVNASFVDTIKVSPSPPPPDNPSSLFAPGQLRGIFNRAGPTRCGAKPTMCFSRVHAMPPAPAPLHTNGVHCARRVSLLRLWRSRFYS